MEKVQALFTACQGVESKYLFRLLAGKLRIGLAEQSLLIALGQASAQLKPSHGHLLDESPQDILKQVYNSVPNYTQLIPALLEHGVWELPKHCRMQPGIPLKPMLAFPTKSITQVLDRFEGVPFTCEYKYDGERAQIHRLADGSIRVFSRNSEDMTQKYPDLVTLVPQAARNGDMTFVLDCEVVAWDPQQQKLLPFQILSTRKRKDVAEDSIQVQVCLFAFDLLFLNHAPLLQTPLEQRRQLLKDSFQAVDGKFRFATYHNGTTTEEIQSFLEEAIASSCEGLMVKTMQGPESFYEPSKRSRNWLKLKKDYLEQAGGLSDSLDLVVIGGYLGRGKRTGGYGGFLLACYDSDSETFQAVCKLGTGFSEADLEAFTSELNKYQIASPPSYLQVDAKPDVWFEPKVVWEVKAADFSLSPVYSAARGLVDAAKGISLRFPRFMRVREDKSPEDATTADQLADMYKAQAILSNNNAPEDEEDYY